MEKVQDIFKEKEEKNCCKTFLKKTKKKNCYKAHFLIGNRIVWCLHNTHKCCDIKVLMIWNFLRRKKVCFLQLKKHNPEIGNPISTLLTPYQSFHIIYITLPSCFQNVDSIFKHTHTAFWKRIQLMNTFYLVYFPWELIISQEYIL